MRNENKLMLINHLVNLINALYFASFSEMQSSPKYRVINNRKINSAFSQITDSLNRLTELNVISVSTGYMIANDTSIIANNKSVHTITDYHLALINALKPYVIKFTHIYEPSIDNYRLAV